MHIGDSAVTPAGEFEILLNTVSGRRYALDTTTNLVTQPFYPYIEDIEAFGDTILITITNLNGEACYYRMRLDP